MTPYQKAGYNELTLFQVPKYLGSSGTVCYATGAEPAFYVRVILCANDSAMEAVVKVSDLKELPKDEDGFYPHTGGECPVPGDWVVEVKLADGDTESDVAETWHWDSEIDPITAFKPISRPDMTSTPKTEDVTQSKQPADIKPRNLWVEARRDDLADAVARSIQEGKPVPPAWTRELDEHTEWLWNNELDKPAQCGAGVDA